MKCNICHIADATTRVTNSTNGIVNEIYLCDSCAKSNSVSWMYTNPSATFPNGVFMKPSHRIHAKKRCNICGLTFDEICRNGKIGCSSCYSVFRDELTPSIKKIHANTTHVGRAGVNTARESSSVLTLEELKKALKSAIAKQQFERCAELRDEIRRIEEGGI